jgi:hypothetical protein
MLRPAKAMDNQRMQDVIASARAMLNSLSILLDRNSPTYSDQKRILDAVQSLLKWCEHDD